MSTDAAVAEILRVTTLFELLADSPLVHPEWLRLISLHQIIGKRGHDTRLVAAMNVHGLRAMTTFNSRDFIGFSEIQILSPHDLAAAWNARPIP